MNGHVIQVRLEIKKKGRFQYTLDQLRIYSSATFKKEIKLLQLLFDKLETPIVKKPTIPELPQAKSEEGEGKTSETVTITEIDPFTKLLYSKQAKKWVNDQKDLETTLASLYNIIWG